MVENVFAVLFGATLAALVLTVIAGVALLAFPRKKTVREAATAKGVPAHP